MLFYTLEFVFLFAALVALLALVRASTPRKLLLLAASAVYYAWWNPLYVLLLVFTFVLHWGIGLLLGSGGGQARRRLLLGAALAGSLGLLALFKYGRFLEENARAVAVWLGFDPAWRPISLALPIGISFFTFQAIGYTVDVYRGRLQACRSPLDFALFVSFFPQIVCGPISRGSQLLPQIASPRRVRLDREAFFLVLRGLVKKVVVADNVAVLANGIFNEPAIWTSVTVWLGALAYYVQIYCDFSGYTDMAIGIARMLGYELPENFRRPYFAGNPSEFWRRWHITLSFWFRDYVFFPLGGPYGRTLRWVRNVMLTFLATGLWHGAGWNFLLWGALHGLGLVVFRLWEEKRGDLGVTKRIRKKRVYKLVAWALMQGWVLITWIPFRVADASDMLRALKKLIVFDFDFRLANIGLGSVSLFSTILILAGFFALHLWSYFRGDLDRRLAEAPAALAVIASAVAGLLLFLFWPLSEAPFIYFQF